jgi:beta-N-acetylhexosaminidase
LRALGRLDSEDHARRMGAALAAELRPCGIGWDMAPVVDVDTNPANPVIGDRSFGADPERVGRLGAAMIHGLQEGGLAACAKHFPGHGDTDLDSHLELPLISHSLGRLREVELPPFRKAIEAGVAAVMTAHVLLPELDEKRPATLSPRILQTLLREDLSYDGVVVSDDFEMKALAQGWPTGEAAVLAAQAGCDLLSVCKSHDAQVAAIEALVRAREGDEIAARAMDASVLRLRRLKERFLLPYAPPDPKQAEAAAGGLERAALAEEIAARSGLPATA